MPESVRLKIVSTGTTHGTRIEDADTGRWIEGVVSVTWDCRLAPNGGGALATAVITVEAVEVDVIGTVPAG